jgi:hypothetical protein
MDASIWAKPNENTQMDASIWAKSNENTQMDASIWAKPNESAQILTATSVSGSLCLALPTGLLATGYL